MGFGKQKDEEEKPKKPVEEKKFVPTTKEQWKKISKSARKRDAEREDEKSRKREREKSKKRLVKDVDGVRKALDEGVPLDIRLFRVNFFEAMVKAIKENEGRLPAYHAFEEQREVRDARFRFDLHMALARMSWMQHTRLIETAVGQSVPTRDWTEAWHAVCQLVKQCFDIRIDKAGNERIRDLEALDEWPVPERKRPVSLSAEEKAHKKDVPERVERGKKMKRKKTKGKEDNMTLDMFEEDEKRRLLAKKNEDEDDERDDEDEEEDEEEDDESDEEDDEEEDKKSKKSKSKKSKKSKSKDDDEEDEEDEDEEDEDEDEDRPSKKERKKVSKGKKSDKSEKKSKKSKSEKPEKASSSGSGDTFKVVKKFKGGIKEEVQALIKSSGSTLDQVVSAARKAKLDKSAAKIKNYLGWLAANGYCKRV